MTDKLDPSWSALFRTDSKQRSAAILAAYYAMTVRERRQVGLGEWYCPAKKSCLLLTVWQSPRGRLGAVPNYTLSHGLNLQESNEAGRRANTRDGDNHWKGDGLVIDELPVSSNLTLTCKHYRGLLDVADVLAAIDGVTPGAFVQCVVGGR